MGPTVFDTRVGFVAICSSVSILLASDVSHLCGHLQGSTIQNTIITAEVSEPNNHKITA